MRMPISFFEEQTTGEILARFTNDIFNVNRGLANTFVKLFREPIKIVFCLAVALWMDWKLTVAVLLVLPPVGLLAVRIGKKVTTLTSEKKRRYQRSTRPTPQWRRAQFLTRMAAKIV